MTADDEQEFVLLPLVGWKMSLTEQMAAALEFQGMICGFFHDD